MLFRFMPPPFWGFLPSDSNRHLPGHSFNTRYDRCERAWGVNDPAEVELDAPVGETIQQPVAATEHNRHQIDDELVEQTGTYGVLNDVRPHESHIPTGGRA